MQINTPTLGRKEEKEKVTALLRSIQLVRPVKFEESIRRSNEWEKDRDVCLSNLETRHTWKYPGASKKHLKQTLSLWVRVPTSHIPDAPGIGGKLKFIVWRNIS